MALGTPCIATNVTGIPEILRDRQTGILIPPSDAIALAAALEQVLSHPAQRVAMAENARNLMEKEFDIHQNSAVMRQIFARSGTLKRNQLVEIEG
jgi:colanic acid/amylovoran biosynthesis glycosyltransferase